MKTLLRLLPVFALLHFTHVVAADLPATTPAMPANGEVVAAVTASDDERTAATKAGDRARLDAVFSDELRYAHSSGKVDTKASYMESLVTHRTVYESFNYKERTFLPAAPGIVLMTGRVLIHARNGEQKLALDLNFLAVWREENGRWRFLAWQSCRN